MSLIDLTYFTKTLSLTGLSGTTAAALAKQAELTDFIARYEPLFLKSVLGDDLFAEFYAGIVIVPPAAKWTALRDKLINSTLKTSPIANYIWYNWQEQHQQISTESADIQVQTAVAATQKYVQVNEQMVDQLVTFYDWFDQQTIYTTYDGTVAELGSINQFGI